MGEIIAVLSGKGGTGKTCVCAGVSAALARAGKRVLAVDCCVGLQDLDISLGMTDSAALNFAEVSRGDYDVAQAARHPGIEGLCFLTAPFRAEDADAGEFYAMLEKARDSFDFILLDAPAGVGPGFAFAARPAQRILVVTNPDCSALRGAARVTDLLEKMGKKELRLVVNRVKKRLFARPQLTVDDMMDQTGIPLLGLVPEDTDVTLAAADGRALTIQTNRGAPRAFEAIAQRLMGNSVPLTIH